ncbi:MAG: metal-dependent transcriptional regulator [Holophagales bacterium]|nr:metal-dependent transcriptional regulator [Holophagales bacterium]
MPTSTVEDYLKTILLEEQRLGAGDLVTMGQIASALEVAPGTVTAMVKTLEKGGLVSYEPYSGVRLSDQGRREATHVLRRHRLIELFLVEILGLDWSEVHAEAELLEHAMSDRLIDRIDTLLGHPKTDPHGDPIPDVEGELPEQALVGLASAPLGETVTVARVSHQEEQFLRFVERHGLRPGARVVLTHRDALADAITVEPEDREPVTLGGEAAAKLWVEAGEGASSEAGTAGVPPGEAAS